MNHNFIELKEINNLINFQNIIFSENFYTNITNIKKCLNCSFLILTIRNSYNFFFINNKEIYNNFTDLSEIPQQTCEEFIIKNIIE